MAEPAPETAPDPAAGARRDVVVLLTEEPVTAADAERVVALHGEEQLDYWVLVPADASRNVLVEVLDRLSLFQLREAARAARAGRPEERAARGGAAAVLTTTLEALRGLGRGADGQVVADDPVPALEAAVSARGAREAVVVTRPRALEESFHRDWASRAREVLGVPVLHTYGGTGEVGSGSG